MRVRLLKPFRAILSTEKEIYINKKLIIKNMNLREYLEEKIGENIKINAENMAKLLKELLETFKKNKNIKVGGTHIDLENYEDLFKSKILESYGLAAVEGANEIKKLIDNDLTNYFNNIYSYLLLLIYIKSLFPD